MEKLGEIESRHVVTRHKITRRTHVYLMKPVLRAEESGTGNSKTPESVRWISMDDPEVAVGSALKKTLGLVVERFVLGKQSVIEAFDRLDITALKADWTSRDEVISRALRHYGGLGVPHYVIIGPGGSVQTLPTVLTPGTVIDALQKAPPTPKRP